MEQVTTVGKDITFSFFLLLALAASASAVFLNTTKQENIVITVTSDRQVRSVAVYESITLYGCFKSVYVFEWHTVHNT